MSSGCDERNQRVGGGSGQATPPPEGCGDPGQAPLAAGRCCCGAGGSGHWTWACGCAWACGGGADGRTVRTVGVDSSFGLATTLGLGAGLGFALASSGGG